MKKRLLWLDDIKNPFVAGMDWWFTIQYLKEEYLEVDDEECEVVWVKTQSEFEKYIKENGLPDLISFDNDLGIGNGEGYSCAKFVIDYCLDHNMYLPGYYVHSMNSVARDNINNLFENFKEIFQNGND